MKLNVNDLRWRIVAKDVERGYISNFLLRGTDYLKLYSKFLYSELEMVILK